MTVIISADDPRTIRALELAAEAGRWATCRLRDGRSAWGIPSQSEPGRYYIVTLDACDCPDFRRRGLDTARLGVAGEHLACKHLLAVRLHDELVRAQASGANRRGRLHLIGTGGQA